MEKNNLHTSSRIIIALASLSLVACYLLPVWFIYLIAPQYPEGLTMNIWLNKITGQVEIINGLNHYIGMKHIKAEMFPEFGYLVYVVGFFIACGLAVAISGKRKWLFGLISLTILGGIAAMVDFYKWGYDYGHNLDPKAAIQIPGLSYQPPLLGHKTLLNFDAYSYPDTGGWVIIAVAIVFIMVWVAEWRISRKAKLKIPLISDKRVTVAAAYLLFTLNSCASGPQPFKYGVDSCDDCKMTIMDDKFGAEIITKKGKVYKFDDAHCITNFLKKSLIREGDISQTVFSDYVHSGHFIDARSTFFVVASQLRTPMNSHVAAFSTKEAADNMAKSMHGLVSTWNDLKRQLQ